MNLRDIISKNLIVCTINDSISIVASKMLEYDIGFIPLIDHFRIVGVVTDRDIACRIFENNDFDGSITDYMSRDVVSVDINCSVIDVLNKMKESRIKRVLVHDKNKVVGVCSISDLLILNDYKDEIYDAIRYIYTIGPNKHKYETYIDEFYL